MGASISKEEHDCCQRLVHPHVSCETWVFVTGYSAFKSALKMYGPLFLWSTLMQTSFKPSFQDIFLRTVPGILRSCIFFAAISSLFPLFMCLYSHAGNSVKPGFPWFSTAFMASLLGIIIEKQSRRRELTLYIGNQALETAYKMGMTRGFLPKIEAGSDIVMIIAFSVLHAFYTEHPELISSSMRSMIKVTVGHEERPDRVERLTSKFYFWVKPKLQGTLPWLFSDGVHAPRPNSTDEDSEKHRHRLCKHRSGCKSYIGIGFLKGFLLGFAIRVTFAILPFLPLLHKIFQVKILKNIFSKIFSIPSLKFGLFVSFMSGSTRLTRCLLRWIRKADDWVNSLISGAVGGLSVIFYRSTEFSMYFVGKALESLFLFGCQKGWISPIPNGEILLFAFSTALLFYASFFEPHNLRPSYLAFLFKASGGHWAHTYKAFSPVRAESGVPSPDFYDTWNESIGKPLLAKWLGKEAAQNTY